MRIHRYEQILVPINNYVRRMTPASRLVLGLLQCVFILGLISSAVHYV